MGSSEVVTISEMDAERVAKDAMDVQARPLSEVPPEDIVVLYHTLVQDGALPPGYELEFAALANVIGPAATREQRRMPTFSNVDAAVWLHDREKRKR